MTKFVSRLLGSLLLAGLVACGGGEGDASAGGVAVHQDATATAGLAQFNLRRMELGLQSVVRNSALDAAAQGHSDYQAVNKTISHYQDSGLQGFTGECLGDNSKDARCPASKVSRLDAAAYTFSQSSYAFGEVISRTASTSGVDAAEALIAAIYHRFVIFEPMFKQVGAGAASVSGGSTYFTTNFTADGLNGGVGRGNLVVYPRDGQSGVARNFFSDQEVPDPVPSRNEVGYPISVHADIWSPTFGRAVVINVGSFTVNPLGGANLSVQSLWSSVDSQTPASVAAIVPLDVLTPNTTYQVQFVGTVDGVAANRAWSFTTGP